MKRLTARDKYLRKRFGITEEEYNIQLKSQGGGCRICRSRPKARRLHVDHDHRIETWNILSEKVSKGVWRSWPAPPGIKDSRLSFYEHAETKPLARAKVKERLKRLSVRGILCWPCNKALQAFRDNPLKMAHAANYVNHYQAWVNGSINEREGFKENDGPDDDNPDD